MDAILQWGLEMVRQAQALGPAFDIPMRLFTLLGQEEIFLLLVPLVFWCLDRGAGANLAYLLILSGYFNSLAKGIFQQPRPYWLDSSVQKITEPSFGLPSGHTQNAISMWSYSAFRLRRTWGWVLALGVIALVSFSRLYLGAHFPTDVLGAWLLGVGLLACYIAFQPRLSDWLVGRGLAMQVGLVVLGVAIVFGLYALGKALFAPGASIYNAALFQGGLDAAIESVFTSAGMAFGGGLGLVLERRTVRFTVAGPVWKRAARYVVGVVGVFGLWAGLKAVFPSEPQALGLGLRFVRYTVMLLWATWIWPWLFVRLGWAAKAGSEW